MSRANTECKTCKKRFHYCSNCCAVWWLDAEYCSFECYQQSERYKTLIQLSEEITKEGAATKVCQVLNTLSDDEQNVLSGLLEKSLEAQKNGQ